MSVQYAWEENSLLDPKPTLFGTHIHLAISVHTAIIISNLSVHLCITIHFTDGLFVFQIVMANSWHNSPSPAEYEIMYLIRYHTFHQLVYDTIILGFLWFFFFSLSTSSSCSFRTGSCSGQPRNGIVHKTVSNSFGHSTDLAYLTTTLPHPEDNLFLRLDFYHGLLM